MARGQRIIPGWLRERTRFCAACLVLSVMLACSAVVINRSCTTYPSLDGTGGIVERTRSDGDITGDGAVDLTDLSALLAAYGTPCP